MVFIGGFLAITCLYVHGTKRNFQGDFMVQKYTFLFLDNVCYLACISTWDMVLGLKTTVHLLYTNNVACVVDLKRILKEA